MRSERQYAGGGQSIGSLPVKALAQACFLLAVLLIELACSKNGGPSRPLREDSLKYVHDEFEIEKATLPVPGTTREIDLESMYPAGPSSRLTYNTRIEKTVKGKSFCVDRIYQYTGVKNAPIEGSEVTGYVGLERLYFTLFACGGIVQYYSIVHKVRPPSDKKNWTPGKYDTGDYCCGDQWPDAEKDTAEYLRQRPEMRSK